MMTLAAALATGLPFKNTLRDESYCPNNKLTYTIKVEEAYEPVWEVQEPPKPLMRVYASRALYGPTGEAHGNHSDLSLGISNESGDSVWRCDITEDLAAALAPYIKKELNL